jgi:hypothetical protein
MSLKCPLGTVASLTEAIAMARSYMGRNAEITMLHQPVIELCNVTD